MFRSRLQPGHHLEAGASPQGEMHEGTRFTQRDGVSVVNLFTSTSLHSILQVIDG